jgi:hypothetical protein
MPPMFLTGGGMRGGPLHPLLRGAPLLAVTTTAPRYRLLSVGDRFPALVPVAEDDVAEDGVAEDGVAEDGVAEDGVAAGVAVEGEVYDVPLDVLRESLLPAEPAELELDVIELADGSSCLAMVLRRPAGEPADLRDISAHRGWRRYRGQA